LVLLRVSKLIVDTERELEVAFVSHRVLLLSCVHASVATCWNTESVVALHEASSLRKWWLTTTILLITLLSLYVLFFGLRDGLIDLLSKVSLISNLLRLQLLKQVSHIDRHLLRINI